MNLGTGVFKAPVNGRYAFAFNANSWEEHMKLSTAVSLRLNGVNIVSSFSQLFTNIPFQAILNLKKGDEVIVHLYSDILFDNKQE